MNGAAEWRRVMETARADDAHYNDAFYATNQPEPEHPAELSRTPSDLSFDFLRASDEAAKEWRDEARYQAVVRAGGNPTGGA